MLIHQGWFTALYTQHLLDSQSFEFEICIFPGEANPIPLHYFPLRGDSPPSLGLGNIWVRQPRSGSCHYPTAATKCNVQPRQATANPVGGKACSSTKGGLLHYIPNTYSIHLVSSLKFAYFQGRLSRHITSPSEKTRPESRPRVYMGKATPVWQLSLSHRCHQM